MANRKLRTCKECKKKYAALLTSTRCHRCAKGDLRGDRTDWRGVMLDRYFDSVDVATPEQRLKFLQSARKVHEHGIDSLRDR